MLAKACAAALTPEYARRRCERVNWSCRRVLAGDPKCGGRGGGASPDLLMVALAALAVALMAPAPAAPRTSPTSRRSAASRRRRSHSPPIVVRRAGRVQAHRAGGDPASPTARAWSATSAPGWAAEARAIAFERGRRVAGRLFTGRGQPARRSPRSSCSATTGEVLGAWHDQQLDSPLARGYSGAIAQKVNAPYVWLPPERPLHRPVLRPAPALPRCFTPTSWSCSASASRSTSSTAARSPPRCRSPTRCSATSSCACWRRGSAARAQGPAGPARAGSVAGMASRGAGRRTHRAQRRRLARDRHRRRRRDRRRPHRPRPGPLQRRLLARHPDSAATSTGRSTTSPTCPFELAFPWHGTGAPSRPPTRRRSCSTC